VRNRVGIFRFGAEVIQFHPLEFMVLCAVYFSLVTVFGYMLGLGPRHCRV
jgi:hypothetical protein